MALVELLMTPGCAGCPQAERIVAQVVGEFDAADWEELDITASPEKGIEHGVMSVPAVLVDGALLSTGIPDRDELRERIRAAIGD